MLQNVVLVCLAIGSVAYGSFTLSCWLLGLYLKWL